MASVREAWKDKEGLRTKVFNDGISNALIGVYKVTLKMLTQIERSFYFVASRGPTFYNKSNMTSDLIARM